MCVDVVGVVVWYFGWLVFCDDEEFDDGCVEVVEWWLFVGCLLYGLWLGVVYVFVGCCGLDVYDVDLVVSVGIGIWYGRK